VKIGFLEPRAEPPADAYGRITDPERYLTLHEFAETAIEGLTRDYVATAAKASRHGFAGYSIERAVAVVPHGHAAPITIAFTTFPGLYVRYGESDLKAYPHCGCDACDESPQRLIEELARDIENFVTEPADTAPWPSRSRRPTR
jgi:hypothetical protein